MTTAPKRGGCFGKSILTIVIVLVVACIVVAGLAYVVAGPAISGLINAVAAPITASNDFMNALIAKDYTKAYGMVHSSQQSSFGGSPEAMQQQFSTQGLQPTTYKFANVQVGTDALVNGTGTFGGNTKYVYISLRKDGDTWKILGLDVNDNAPTATPTS